MTSTATRQFNFAETVDSFAGLDIETLRRCHQHLKAQLDGELPEQDRAAITFSLNAVIAAGKRLAEAAPAPVAAPAPRRYEGTNSIWAKVKQIPEGRYAFQEGGQVTFYVVSRPTEGRYAGWTFANKLSSDNEINLGKTEGQRVLKLIAADPESASALYGQRVGRCGICHRTLTDDKPGGSIERGIGPVCAGKAGW